MADNDISPNQVGSDVVGVLTGDPAGAGGGETSFTNAPSPTDSSADFSSGAFTVDQLKQLDLETKTPIEIATLARQLLPLIKPDGIWDGQKIAAVPLVGRPPTNLVTQIGVGSGKPPIEQDSLLFSVEIAYWIAQIAHELEKRQLYREELKGAYAAEPELLLADWVREQPNHLTLQAVERRDHWATITDVLLDGVGTLNDALAAGEGERDDEAEKETAQEAEKKQDDSADKKDVFEWLGKDEKETEAGGEEAPPEVREQTPDETPPESSGATPRRRAPLSSPEEAMRSFLAAGGGEAGKALNQRYLGDLKSLGFSADERRLIVDQTAWIYSGVLAQVFPDAIGRFESLDPAARAQVNQLVRDYIMALPNRQAVLADLIANPLGRRELITDILRSSSTRLSVLAQRDEGRLKSDIEHLGREQLITQQLPSLTDYLVTQAAAEGTTLPIANATTEAYNALSKLTDAQLRQLAAGVIPTRVQIYEAAAKTTAQKTFLAAVAKINTDLRLENKDAQNIVLSLDSFLLNVGVGRTVGDLVEYIGGVPAKELLEIAGIDDTSPLYPRYIADIEAFRNSVQFYVQTRAATFNIPTGSPTRATTTEENEAIDRPHTVQQGVAVSRTPAAGAVTPVELYSTKKAPETVAAAVVGTTAARSKAFFKHYLERWNTLSIDEQVVVCLLTDKAVPKTYLQQNPPVELLEPAMGFIDLEQQIRTPLFQRLVKEFGANRSAFKNRSRVNALQNSFKSGDAGAKPVVVAPDRYQQAAAFEERYASSWATLSNDEKVAVYLVAGVPVAAGQELAVIYTYADLADRIGTPEFQTLVQEVAQNRTIYTDAKQQEAFTQFIVQQEVDTKLSNYLVSEQKADIQTTLLVFANLSAEAQEKTARILGFASADQFVAVYQEAATSQLAAQQFSNLVYSDTGGAAGYYPIVAPEALAFANTVENQGEHAGLLSQLYPDAPERAAEPAALAAQQLRSGSGVSGVFNQLSHARKTNDFNPLVQGANAAKHYGKAAVKKSLAAIDKSIGLALNAVPVAGKALSTVWNNKYGKALFAAPVLLYLKAISSLPGAAGALIGGTIGAAFPVLGPATPFLYSFGGALIGDWLNSQFFGGGSWLGVRTPPSPFAEPAVESAYGNRLDQTSTEASQVSTTQASLAKPVAATTTVAVAANALWSVVAWPVYAIASVVLMSLAVMLVIWGAFLAPSPIEPVPGVPPDGQYQPSAKYVTVTKAAQPSAFPNPSGGETYDVTYTISVVPQSGYRLKLTAVTDTYSSFGKTPVGQLTSPLTLASFGSADASNQSTDGLITTPITAQYTQTGITGEDAYLTNKVTITFDAYDYLSDQPVEASQTYSTSSFVTIGKPEIGCWPTDGTVTSIPFSGIPTHAGSDAFDIAAPLGTPVYAPFPGTACSYSIATGYGQHVRLFSELDVGQGSQPLTFIFGHLSAFSDALAGQIGRCGAGSPPAGGTPVAPGEIIGFVGSTGNSTGPHLHFELANNYHGGLTGGAYQSVLRLLIPGGQEAAINGSVQSCFK